MKKPENPLITAVNNRISHPEKTVINLFEMSCERFAGNPMFWEKSVDRYEASSYGEMRERIYRFACGLLQLGVKKGDRIAILSQARKDWVTAELGILYAGAISVPLSARLESAELAFRLDHSGARMVVTSAFEYPKINGLVSTLPELEKVILLDSPAESGMNEIFIGDLLNTGEAWFRIHENQFKSNLLDLKGDDCALISYTSGTTADAKGIMLSHKNLVTNTEQSLQLFSVGEDWRILLIIPLDHSFAHTTGMYVFLASGASLAAVKPGRTPAATLKNVFTNIREIQPDALLSVPTLAKNLKKNIENGIRKKGTLARHMFNLGIRAGSKYSGEGWNRGKGFRLLYWPLYKFTDGLVFSSVRKSFGGNLKFFVGGGALLDVELQRFFLAVGLPMYQGYGLTEASPVISSNTAYAHKLGSSGKVVPGLDIKICDEQGNEVQAGHKGEIVVHGDNVMLGYYRNEEATREAIRNGWLYTGDMGYLDSDGYLFVLGRFKSLLIGNDGEKYSPEGIEEYLEETSSLIRQIMIYNNQNPYTTALIFPDAGAVSSRLGRKSADPVDEPTCRKVLEMIRDEIGSLKNGDNFPQRWIPATFSILEEGFTEENHFLNSTMKMVRGKITLHYRERIEYMYTPEGKDIVNPRNLEAVGRLLQNSRCLQV